MSLCAPARCGCSITSDTLSVVNNGNTIRLEVAALLNAYPLFNFQDSADRDAQLTDPQIGMEAWLRSTNVKTAWNGASWRVIEQGRTTFSPSASQLSAAGIVVGLGSFSAFYSRVGEEVFFNGRFVFGGGSAFTGFVMPLPVPCANTNRNVGEAGIYDASTNIIHPVQLDVWTDVAYGLLSNGTSVFPLTSLSPITWAASDEIWWNVRYPAA